MSTSDVALLRSPSTVRERARNVLTAGLSGELAHFTVQLERLSAAVDLTLQVTRRSYPTLEVPVHGRINHFAVGGVPRAQRLAEAITDPAERARTMTELIVTSVLLDAGAGASWCFREPGTGLSVQRSEGLAVASYHAFAEGVFASDSTQPWRADAAGLERVDAERLGRAFQVRSDNPLVGLEGRAALLRRLGEAVRAQPAAFAETGRVGGLFDALARRAEGDELPAPVVLATLLEALGPIWPSRTRRFGVELGDVWPHPAAGGEGATRGLVPLHKLSQWLCYSLVSPLEQAGLRVTRVAELTGLAEYRNGGLFFDTGVIVPKHPSVERDVHAPGSELVVEWRALTVALLDRLAAELRTRLGMSEDELPLGKILEGGTWAAGRLLAAERRQGAPPIRVESDGTLF